jgi:hypothetical protein
MNKGYLKASRISLSVQPDMKIIRQVEEGAPHLDVNVVNPSKHLR